MKFSKAINYESENIRKLQVEARQRTQIRYDLLRKIRSLYLPEDIDLTMSTGYIPGIIVWSTSKSKEAILKLSELLEVGFERKWNERGGYYQYHGIKNGVTIDVYSDNESCELIPILEMV